MINRPRLKPHLHSVQVDETCLLIAEGRYTAIEGRACGAVLREIDGDRSADAVVDRLIGEYSPTDIYGALILLERGGHIEEASERLSEPDAAFWTTLGVSTLDAAARLAASRVAVNALGRASPDALAGSLADMQIQTIADGWGDLRVVVVEDYLDEDLAAINAEALETRRPWLPLKPNGIFTWLGPLFRPHVTGCWACLAQRLRGHREVEEFAAASSGRTAPYAARAGLGASLQATEALAAVEIAKWCVLGESAALDGHVLTLDTLTLETRRHRLTRRPQCPMCGEPEAHQVGRPGALALQSVRKRFTEDGGHRAAPPDETLRRYEHHVGPITGITKNLSRITPTDGSPLHVYTAGINLATRHTSLQRVRRSLRSACCGKGVTDAQARVSGLCEAAERYSGVFRGDEYRLRSSLTRLGDRGIDPRRAMLFSERQYAERDRWNALDRRLDMVPLPFDPAVDMDWTAVWSLTEERTKYLPTSQCFYATPTPRDHFFCLPDSNGAAAGNTPEEAVLQGFLELVERDSVALWWYNRVRRTAVDLDSFDDPFFRAMTAHYATLSRDLWVLDLTADMGIPAFVAISRRADAAVEDIVFAPAAHLDARMGILRALTELNQMMPGVAGSRGDGTGYAYDDPEAIAWWRTATLRNQPHFAPAGPMRQARHYATIASDDLLEDVLFCQRKVEALGFEMLVLDQTRPDIGIPVVKVVVPGLRHFWARYAPGRLYDVPVALGWLAAPLAEADLNPIPVFI